MSRLQLLVKHICQILIKRKCKRGFYTVLPKTLCIETHNTKSQGQLTNTSMVCFHKFSNILMQYMTPSSGVQQVKKKKREKENLNYFPIQFRPGLVDCRPPYGEGALETSHRRSYITHLTAAIRPCFHFNHECSCVGEQWNSLHVNPLKAGWFWPGLQKCTVGCWTHFLDTSCPSAAPRITQFNVVFWTMRFWGSVKKHFVLKQPIHVDQSYWTVI